MNHTGGTCICGHCQLSGIEKAALDARRENLPTGLANREIHPDVTYVDEYETLRIKRLFEWAIGAVEGEVE